MFRVMQITETGEMFCQIEGALDQCEAWLAANADQYEESRFMIERI